MVPLHALMELWLGTFPVYVPSLKTAWKAFPLCISCLLSESRFSARQEPAQPLTHSKHTYFECSFYLE